MKRLFGFIHAWVVEPGDDDRPPRIRWRRMALALLAVLIAGYATGSAGVFWFVRQQRGLKAVSFSDVALPWRWRNYRLARGEDLIRQAQEHFAAERYHEALMYGRTGLAHAPAHREGRLLCARLLIANGQPAFARRLLLEGLSFHSADRAYWQPLLDWLLYDQADAVVIGLARRFLPRLSDDPALVRPLALAAATASYHRRDHATVSEYLRASPGLAASVEGRLLLAKCALDGGYRELARVQLDQLAAEYPEHAEVHAEWLACLRALDQPAAVRRAMIAFEIAQPALATARLDALRLYYQEHDPAAIGNQIAALLADFGGNVDVLLAAAGAAAEAGDVATVERLVGTVRRLPGAASTSEFLTVEALLVKRDYDAALARVRALAADDAMTPAPHAALLASLRAIAYLGRGDVADARAFLGAYLDQPRLHPANLLAVADRLAALDGGELARLALKRALEIDPRYQPAATRLVELDLALNCVDDLAADARRVAELRRPSLELLRVVQHRLGSDAFIFSADKESALAAIERLFGARRH